jgi:hypothetical protein
MVRPCICTSVQLMQIVAIDEEGLFRLSGSHSDVIELRKQLDKGKKVDWTKIRDPHLVTGVLKGWVRAAAAATRSCSGLTSCLQLSSLSDPLLTYELYDCFIALDGTQIWHALL